MVFRESRGTKLLRVSHAAHESGLHPLTVREWIKTDKIHILRSGNEARIQHSETEQFTEKQMGDCQCCMTEWVGRDKKSI